MGSLAKNHKELRVYQNAMAVAMEIFQTTKAFPSSEKYSLIDQIRRCSRSVCSNLAEAWRKRRYRAAFIAKLSDAESEACETQVWLEIAVKCGYLESTKMIQLDEKVDQILKQVVYMIDHADDWTIS